MHLLRVRPFPLRHVHSKRRADVQRLLDEGVDADLDAAGTPYQGFGCIHLDAHRVRRAAGRGTACVGLDDPEIVDVINGAAFFNWANRLMLSLGEPTKGIDA